VNCVHYSQTYCFKSPETNKLNFINNNKKYDLAIDNRNDSTRCGNNGKFYEFIGPYIAIKKEKYLTTCIFMGLVSGVTNIISPSFTGIPALTSVLFGIFYIGKSWSHKTLEKEEELRIKIYKENEENKKNDENPQVHEYTTSC
jgi:hypothetical protein